MKILTVICALSLSFTGCSWDRAHQDSFTSLHALVTQTLVDSSDCGLITTNEVVGGRYFEVKPLPRGLLVTVSEQQFFSQEEWERRYVSGTNLMYQFMEFARTNQPIDTNHPIDVKIVERFAGLTNDFGLAELPKWHYRSIGVDVHVQEVDEVYPGSDQDNAEAQKRYAKIVRLLEPYDRANKPLHSTASGPSVLTKP